MSVGLLVLGECEQVRAAVRELTRVRDYIIVGAPRFSLSHDEGTDRQRLIDSMESIVPRLLGPIPRTPRFDESDGDAGPAGFRSFGVIARDANGLYVGNVARIPGRAGEFRQVSVLVYTLLNRRMVYYSVYADYEAARSLPSLLKWTQTELARAVASN